MLDRDWRGMGITLRKWVRLVTLVHTLSCLASAKLSTRTVGSALHSANWTRHKYSSSTENEKKESSTLFSGTSAVHTVRYRLHVS
jgi:hypothetical protein